MVNLENNERAAYVQDMFNRIARRYDIMNRLITFGQDQRWRRFVIRQAALPTNGRLLDVGTGTGDILFEARKLGSTLSVVGLDFALEMLRVGMARGQDDMITWCQGDALALPFSDEEFDAVTSTYLIRNVSDPLTALQEQLRVVKPGGRVVCLDTSPPPRNILRPFIMFHLKYIIPLLGTIVAGDRDAYAYLPDSTQAFKTPDELADLMRQAGLSEVTYRSFMFGMIVVLTGQRPQEDT